MIHNYIKTTLRHLWRNKTFTLLNVLGLAIGISACWIIYRIVDYEFSFDRTLPNKENTYRLVTGFIYDEEERLNGGISKPIPQAIGEQVTGIDRVVPVFGQQIDNAAITSENGKSLIIDEPDHVVSTSSNYFDMVPYIWLAGSAQYALDEPFEVVLTSSRASSYFPGLSPKEVLGRYIVYNDTLQMHVSGIVEDLNFPSEFIAKEFFALTNTNYPAAAWASTNGDDKVYLQLSENASTTNVLAQINTISSKKFNDFMWQSGNTFSIKRWHELVALVDMHFTTNIPERIHKVNKQVMYGLIGVAIFLIVLASINYINLSTAQISQRVKEIGIRKTLGSARRHLMVQILAETFVIVLIAVLLSFILSRLSLDILKDTIPAEALLYKNPSQTLLFIIILLLGTTFLSGFYPGWLITKVQPVQILRGRAILTGGKKRFTLRKGLITFQFVVAQMFIVSALIVGAQLNYTLMKDMGFGREAIITIDVPWKISQQEIYKGRQLSLRDELEKEAGIVSVSLGNVPLSSGYSSDMYSYEDDKGNTLTRQVYKKAVDTNYIGLYQMKIIAGRNLSASDTVKEYVINETAVKSFGFKSPEEALGKLIGQGDSYLPIVGVVNDFHTANFYSDIEPVALLADKSNFFTFNIKLNISDPIQWQHIIKAIEKKWEAFYPPETFSYKFYDETLESLYQQERNMSHMINLATGIAIIISCLGLFGLASLTAFQRTKEIGIRKVMGASVTGIVQLLSKDFVKLVFIAIVIASPIAWYAMNRWLEVFAYRIDIEWWMFGLAGLIAVVIALATVSFQAIKAAVANPVNSLRSE